MPGSTSTRLFPGIALLIMNTVASTCDPITKTLQIPTLVPSALCTLLSSFGDISETSTLNQVLDALKDYIFFRKLYDRKDPRVIHCQNDELGNILGVHQFTLYEIKSLMLKILTAGCGRNSDGQEKSIINEEFKRKLEDSDISLTGANKRQCSEALSRSASPIYLYIPSTPEYNSADETDFSFQGYETACAKDSSDDLWFLEEDNNSVTFENTYALEYEVESLTSNDQSVSDTDSEIEDVVQAAVVTKVSKTDSDMEFWADHSSDNVVESDVEISEADRWECKRCGSLNKPPARFCQKCWDERIGWLPDRHERKPPSRHKSRKGKKNDDSAAVVLKTTKSEKSWSTSPGFFDDTDLSRPCTSQQNQISQPSSYVAASSQSQSNSFDEDKLCSLCCAKPKNATIVHGKTGHQLTCYRCARYLQSRKKPCPSCRRTIEKVIHQFLL